MAYAVYSFASQYTDTGLIGVYVGTREDNLAERSRSRREQIADIAAGNLRDRELERAKENLKGRIVLSMESTSNADEPARQVADHRHGAPLARPDHRGGRRGRAGSSVAELAAVLLAPERLSAAGIGPRRGALPRRRSSASPRPLARAAA